MNVRNALKISAIIGIGAPAVIGAITNGVTSLAIVSGLTPGKPDYSASLDSQNNLLLTQTRRVFGGTPFFSPRMTTITVTYNMSAGERCETTQMDGVVFALPTYDLPQTHCRDIRDDLHGQEIRDFAAAAQYKGTITFKAVASGHMQTITLTPRVQ